MPRKTNAFIALIALTILTQMGCSSPEATERQKTAGFDFRQVFGDKSDDEIIADALKAQEEGEQSFELLQANPSTLSDAALANLVGELVGSVRNEEFTLAAIQRAPLAQLESPNLGQWDVPASQSFSNNDLSLALFRNDQIEGGVFPRGRFLGQFQGLSNPGFVNYQGFPLLSRGLGYSEFCFENGLYGPCIVVPPPQIWTMGVDEPGFKVLSEPNRWYRSGAYPRKTIFSTNKRRGNKKVQFTFNGLPPVPVRVSATWFSAVKDWATNAPFHIYDGGRLIQTVYVNHHYAPGDFVDNSRGSPVPWGVLLEGIVVTSGQLRVVVSNGGNANTNVQAIHIQALGF